MKVVYGVAVNRDSEGRHVVSVRDLPEVCTDGATRVEALTNAVEAMQGVLLAKIDLGDPITTPSSIELGEVPLAPNLGAISARLARLSSPKAKDSRSKIEN
ncbi:type II toxin-antitoxin system HicB family antitoxin [bacterium]|nr:type II toxin-antitoxin system HicB family antitoxin [bacterium]